MKKRVVGLIDSISVIGKNKVNVLAKFDTGAKRTSVDYKVAAKAMIGPIVGVVRTVQTSSKKGTRRAVAKAKFSIAGKNVIADVNLTDRSHSKQKVLIGRDIIKKNFVVDLEK